MSVAVSVSDLHLGEKNVNFSSEGISQATTHIVFPCLNLIHSTLLQLFHPDKKGMVTRALCLRLTERRYAERRPKSVCELQRYLTAVCAGVHLQTTGTDPNERSEQYIHNHIFNINRLIKG